MEIVVSIVDGVVAIIQSIIFGAVMLAGFFIFMKYRVKKQPTATQEQVEPKKEKSSPVFIDTETGEVL